MEKAFSGASRRLLLPAGELIFKLFTKSKLFFNLAAILWRCDKSLVGSTRAGGSRSESLEVTSFQVLHEVSGHMQLTR